MKHDPDMLAFERARTNPEYIMFTPTYVDNESDNVHLSVVEHPGFGGLMAFWTQSTFEDEGNNHIVMATSRDGGVTWTEPKYILGTYDIHGIQASWGFPVLSKSGRIYLFYFRETGEVTVSRQVSSVFACVYSDDLGNTWSESVDVPLRKTPYDTGNVQNNVVFQLPFRTREDKVFFGYTKWTSRAVKPGAKLWYHNDTHVFFAQIENIDEDPLPQDIRFTFLPDDENGVGLPVPEGTTSVAQEPCIVILPDGRLFCSMRTSQGFPAYTVSEDGGHTWREPKAICYDNGTPLVHPLSPCPIFEVEKGQYILLFHNQATDIGASRNTLYKVRGYFDPEAEQPVVFPAGSEQLWMEIPDKDCPFRTAYDLAMYGSMTRTNGKNILWYPDRKFFLLGKELK